MLPYLEAMLDNPILEEAANILVRFIEDGARLHMSLIALEKLLEQARQANVALAALWKLRVPVDRSRDPSDGNRESYAFFDASVAGITAMLKQLEKRWNTHLEVLGQPCSALHFERDRQFYAQLARDRRR